MTERLDLPRRYRDQIEALLREHVPGVEVWAYGSRVSGRSHEGSDLDLVLRGPDLKRIDSGMFLDLIEALEESNIPIIVQAHDWARLPESFQREIERAYVVLMKGREDGVESEWRETVYGRFSSDFVEDCLMNLCDEIDGVQTGPFGSQLHKRDYVSSGTPIITVEHLGENRILHRDLPQVSAHDRERLSKYSLQKGDIVFSRVGSVDRRALVRESENGWLFSGRCLRVRTDPNKIDSTYLSYFFGLPSFKEHIRAIAVGATMPSLNTKILSDIVIPHPCDLNEQRAIAHILGTLDDKIELNRRMNETLEEMARALFKSWFVDFDPVRAKMEGRDTGLPPDVAALFPDRLVDSELGAIPEGWEVRPLATCFNLTMGQSPPGSTYNDDGDGLPFFQGCSDFEFRYPENRRFCTAPTRIAHPDDTLVSVRAPVGEINMAWEKCCIGRGVAALRHKSDSISFTYYATQVLQPQLRQYEETGTVFGAINGKQFKTLPVLEPKAELLDCFEIYVLPLEQRIRVNVSESCTLAALRDTLLPKLMSGEMRL